MTGNSSYKVNSQPSITQAKLQTPLRLETNIYIQRMRILTPGKNHIIVDFRVSWNLLWFQTETRHFRLKRGLGPPRKVYFQSHRWNYRSFRLIWKPVVPGVNYSGPLVMHHYSTQVSMHVAAGLVIIDQVVPSMSASAERIATAIDWMVIEWSRWWENARSPVEDVINRFLMAKI